MCNKCNELLLKNYLFKENGTGTNFRKEVKLIQFIGKVCILYKLYIYSLSTSRMKHKHIFMQYLNELKDKSSPPGSQINAVHWKII